MAAIQTALSARISNSIGTAAGDIIYFTGNATPARLPIGTANQILTVSGGVPTWSTSSSVADLSYVEATSSVSVTATTEATAQTVVTAGAVTLSSNDIWVEFFSPEATAPAVVDAHLDFVLYDGSSSIGKIGLLSSQNTDNQNAPVFLKRKLTSVTGTKTYSIRAFVSSGTGSAGAGVGGTGALVPAYIRVYKA